LDQFSRGAGEKAEIMTDDGRIDPPGGPWGRRDSAPEIPREPPRPASEPFFNAPWQSTALIGAIIGAYAVQSLVGGGEAMAARAGFSPSDLTGGRPWTLLTSLLMHNGWGHALSNALAALIFGPPVARLFGSDWRGASAFFLFSIVCGVLASLGWAAMHWNQPVVSVGASGAIFGLIGGASRIYGRDEGLSPIFSPLPMGMAAAFLVVNLLYGIFGNPMQSPGVLIAWEAHVVGFVAGLVLIKYFARALRRA
jgi:membrane associated rhomboid family serine protease